MARLAATAVGGYYPTPTKIVSLVRQHLGLSGDLGGYRDTLYNYLDPCAGEGSAIAELLTALHGVKASDQIVYSVEMEKGRHEALTSRMRELSWKSEKRALLGDAFKVQMVGEVSLLWLNPPYGTDPIIGRLEEHFLARFCTTLTEGGVLVFIIPGYSLGNSASTLAQHFDRVECYRFPDPDYVVFKQVILFATKRCPALPEPDPELQQRIKSWSSNAVALPVAGQGEPFILPTSSSYSVSNWTMAPVDFTSLLASIKPWHKSDKRWECKPITSVTPTDQDVLTRSYTVAMPPKPAHIAAGIAAGIFNGQEIVSSTPGLPNLLIKGVFDKEFRTVEEKTDKNGRVKGLVQVQQPKLVTTVLDLSKGLYTTIKASTNLTGTLDVTEMTMADLLGHYGESLMRVMLRQCKVMHDPNKSEHQIPLPELNRDLFPAQHQAAQAAVKLLGGLNATRAERRFKSAFVLGEIGSGKSSLALAAARAINSKRTLILCPPHLLDSWMEQITEVLPWFRTVVLDTISDVQELATLDCELPTIAIMSREAAKLGHRIESGLKFCPKCGNVVEQGIDLAKRRAKCTAQPLISQDGLGDIAIQLGLALLPAFPENSWLSQVLTSKHLRRFVAKERIKKQESENPTAYTKEAWDKARSKILAVVGRLLDKGHVGLALSLLKALPDPALLIRAAKALADSDDTSNALDLLLLVDNPEVIEAAEKIEGERAHPWYNSWKSKHDHIWKGTPSSAWSNVHRDTDGDLVWQRERIGDPQLALKAFAEIANTGFKKAPCCGEALFQAVPHPRRYPLAKYITRFYPKLFDFLVLDECHEYSTSGSSAQSHAAHRVMTLGIPSLLMTGTVMNGYAESLFMNTWSASPKFRNEFERGDLSRFVDRFGYRKRLIEEKVDGQVVEFGTVTDRVEHGAKIIGRAPGVLPLFLFQHLLPLSVTLHKRELVEIPDCTELVDHVQPEKEQLKEYENLRDALLGQIKLDRFDPDLAGKLWGALAEMPSYLDLATSDTGNTDEGSYVVSYPESVGGQVVYRAKSLPKDRTLPKESWLIKRLESSLAEGRNVLVFVWHTKLITRIAKIITSHLGIEAPILDPAKVPTKKRQGWIDGITKRGCRVLVVNPVTIQTGLNNLVYFSDEVWLENCACNPVTYRQAIGRVDRIGQKEPTRIFFPLYKDTSQEDLHSLLLHKVAVSMSTDGLDGESALQAAGIGETGFSSFEVGRQLYNILSQEVRHA